MKARDWMESYETGERARVVLPARDDGESPTSIEPVAPRRRDFLKVLLGRWEPRVVVHRTWTLAGMNRALRLVWTREKLEKGLISSAEWLEFSQRDDD